MVWRTSKQSSIYYVAYKCAIKYEMFWELVILLQLGDRLRQLLTFVEILLHNSTAVS